MTKMLGQDGLRGVDVETPKGTRSLNADRSGKIEVNDSKLVKQLKAEGFTVASSYSGFATKGFPCPCGHNSIFKTCGKCGKENG